MTSPDWLVAIVRCPACRSSVRRAHDAVECANGHRYRDDGHLDLWSDDTDDVTRATVDSFGYEWTTFDANNDEDVAFWSRHSSDLDLSEFGEALALDAGCGKGRYTRFIAPQVGRLVALDASEAAVAAARNMKDLDNVGVVRADLRAVPFDPASFDFVSSIGVLHHLSDPRDGFLRLAGLLRPGGRMFVYLYSRPEGRGVRAAGLAVADRLRLVTVRVPHRLLRIASIPMAALLWLGLVLPGSIGERLGLNALAGLPMHTYRHSPFRALWLDTFDRLSAPVEHRYVWSELAPWFEDAGLDVVAVREDAGFYIVADRPSGVDRDLGPPGSRRGAATTLSDP